MNTYTALLHTHTLVVILFVVHYLIKTVLLLINRKEALASYTAKTKVPEMILATAFLVTGVWMLLMIGQIRTLLVIKIVAVLASIPLAVVGFRRQNKILAGLAMLLLIGSYGMAEVSKRAKKPEPIANADIITDPAAEDYKAEKHGKALYLASGSCVTCHGVDGKKQMSGAKDLSLSERTDEEIKHIILNGKNGMPKYKGIYTETELNALVAYVKTYRE